VEAVPPLVTAFKIAPAGLRKSAKLTFKLSEPAQVVVTITRRGGKPVRIKLSGVRGANAKKLKRGHLKRGRYTAVLVATDAAGNKSVPRRLTFRVV
jgi:hypothetical protein